MWGKALAGAWPEQREEAVRKRKSEKVKKQNKRGGKKRKQEARDSPFWKWGRGLV
jgi:hypothetical protein